MTIKMTIPPKLPEIPSLDADVQQAALERQSQLLKPQGALGQLEILSVRLAGMTGDINWRPQRPAVIVCAGDHGVAERGVSAYPRGVTKQMVNSFLNARTAVTVLAEQAGATVTVVDAGVAGILPEHERLVSGKINYGTADFTDGPAMSPGQADKAIQLGLDAVNVIIDGGADVIALGEMGIGNTTVAAALTAALTGADVANTVGRGTGISNEQLATKQETVKKALTLHQPVDEDTLPKLGGYEIGAMVGVMMGAAARRVPVVLDGYTTTAAALIAARIDANVVNYCVAGHVSAEQGHAIALQTLGLTPIHDLSMRLGEATGAVLALPVIAAAMRLLQGMSTFDEAGVSGAS